MSQLLIVSEDITFLNSVKKDLEPFEYTVFVTSSLQEAVEIIKSKDIKLIVTEISNEQFDAYILLDLSKKINPEIDRLLITDSDIERDLVKIKDFHINNIIPRHEKDDNREIVSTISIAMGKNFFGLEQYLLPGSAVKKELVSNPDDAFELAERLSTQYGVEHNINKIKTSLSELITNAIFYGAKNEDGSNKASWVREFELAPEDAIEVYHGKDSEKAGFAIVDKGGKLNSKTILHWLERQYTVGDNGLPKGIFDTHGRGLFISRKFADRMIINVEHQKMSECIILNYFNKIESRSKPLLINEI